MDHKKFEAQIFRVISTIPHGRVITYGQIAALAGLPRNARLVGRILSRCTKGVYPCYRVVNAAGRCVPGWAEQRALLAGEGVTFKENGCVDMKRHSIFAP